MTPLELQKWLKWTTNVQNIPKPNKMNKPPPKQRQNPRKQKWPKYYWILKNKQNTLESSENNQNTPKLNQNTLGFLDFWGILVALKLFRSLKRILGHSTHFTNFEGYFFIIINEWGILVIFEVQRFECSF